MPRFKVEIRKTTKNQPLQNGLRFVRSLLPRIPFGLWVVGALAGVVLLFGTPHLIVTYECYGSCMGQARHADCHYFGVQGWRRDLPFQGQCRWIRFFPLDL